MATSLEVPILRHAIHIPALTQKEPTISITSTPPTPTSPTKDARPDNTLVLSPTLITTDFDLLRFSAAAFDQLPKPHQNLDAHTLSTSLISSPYNNPSHYLDLTTLPLPSLLFAKALTALRPLTPAYATTPYTSALNFEVVINLLRDFVAAEHCAWPETKFYVVVFSSELKPAAEIDEKRLYKLDYESHREACESGGLLKYWFGRASAERRNLATCFWHSRADAHKGGLGPWHAQARAAKNEMYEDIVFSTYDFVVEEGVRGWRLEEVKRPW